MEDDQGRPAGERRGSSTSAAGGADGAASLSPVFLMWENTLDKLKALNYETNFCQPANARPFTRSYFALPADNAGLQFRSFQEITAWLVAQSTGDAGFFSIDKYDDPNTSVNKMMLALKNMAYPLDFPANRLKQAHGEAVCSVLDFLTDRALQKRGFVWGRAIYQEEDMAEEAEVDDEADLGEIADETEVHEEEEALFSDLKKHEDDESPFAASDSHYQILESKVDPVEWKKELERVGPKLKAGQPSLAKEWRLHVEQTKKHEDTIQKALPDVLGQLSSLSTEVADGLEKMNGKERYINNQHEAIRVQFQQLSAQQKEVEATYRASASMVNELTNQLAGLSEELDEVKDQMGEHGSKAESSPLVAIKQALQQIKAEIKTFDLRIGVVSHSLLATKVRLGNSERKANKRTAAQRQNGNKTDQADYDMSDSEGPY